MKKLIHKSVIAKEAMEQLLVALNFSAATKEGIAGIAKEVADSVANPLVSTIAIKPLEEFFSEIKKNLKDKAIEMANDMPDSQKRVGNLTYATAVKNTYSYDNPELKEMKSEVKDFENELKEAGECKCTETPYIRVTIPKT